MIIGLENKFTVFLRVVILHRSVDVKLVLDSIICVDTNVLNCQMLMEVYVTASDSVLECLFVSCSIFYLEII